MKNFTVFDASGRILRTGTCQDETLAAQAMSSGESVVELVGAWATQYVVAGEFVSRPGSSVSLAQTGASIVLTGVAAGIQPVIFDATGNSTSLDSTTDGSPISTALATGVYTISVDQFPELPFSQQVTIS